MIVSRISTKGQTTIPLAVRTSLGLREGDRLAYEIEDGRVVLTRADNADDPFASFTEWNGDAEAYGSL